MPLPPWLNLALLGSVCAVAPALAANWEMDNTRLLGDPSFLPSAGQVEGIFAYSYTASLADSTNSNPFGGHTSSDRSTNNFLPTLRYGITDDISVYADFGWGNEREVADRTYEGFVFLPRATLTTLRQRESYRFVGPQDPAFGATWRVIDQRTAPFSVDLTGTYAPDIFQSRSAGNFQTGTLATGGQQGSLQLAISREMQMLTLRAYGTFTYDGRRNDIAVGGLADVRSAAHASYAAGLQSQTRVLPWLAIDAGVTASMPARYDETTIGVGGNTSQTEKSLTTISPYAGLTVPLLGQNLVGVAQYQHDFIPNQTVDTSSGSTLDEYKRESNVYTVRVLFTFGGAPAPMPAPMAQAAPQPAPAAVPVAEPARTYLVFFDWDRADLSDRARGIVAAAAQAATHVQTTRIEVDGYTDLSGTAAYNQKLSVRRAQSVATELVRDGVAENEIDIHGFGETHPLVATAQGVREPQNRRVEIVLK